ncbi:prominin-1-A-like [Pelodytes ibericus]
MEFQNISSPAYKPEAAAQGGGVKIFNDMVHSYLDLVQPNTFPASKSDIPPASVLNYEVGFLVAIALGILFIVLMTLVGLFFACCRCCGNCGGKMYQKQTKKMDCKRCFLYLFLLLITLIILAGNICAFYTNSKISAAVTDTLHAYSNTADNLRTYIKSVPQEINDIIVEGEKTIETAKNTISGIGPILGGQIQMAIGKVANVTLASIQQMVTVLNNTVDYMVSVNESFHAVRQEQAAISQNLTDVRGRINKTVSECGGACASYPSVDNLVLDANYNTIPDFGDQIKTINEFLNSGIESTLQKVYKALQDIPDTVTNETKSAVSDVQTQLNKIKETFSEVRSISIADTIQSLNTFLNTSDNNVEKLRPDIQRYDYYRWIVGICLCCIVLLVVVCNLFGLFFGPCGHRVNVDPTERSCLSNSAGDFFMAGAGFSFLFAWLLMLIVSLLFIIGGNSYTLICKPWANRQIFTFIDNQVNLTKELNISVPNISTLYSECEKNYPMWQVLNLNDKFNLDQYLNISQYTGEVNSTFNNTQININEMTFLSSTQKDQLRNISSLGIEDLNFTDIKKQMQKGITKTNLTSFADSLDSLAASVTNSTISNELKSEAADLRSIQLSIDTRLMPQIRNLNKSLINLETTSSSNLSGDVNSTLNSVDVAQNYVDRNVSDVIKAELRNFLETLLQYFQSYTDWARLMITQNMARCGPVGRALNSAQIVLCNYIVDSLNGFWFSLGWCTIFFLPSIILSVKLAKYYRRMKSSDILENQYDHMEMTSNSQQFLIPRVTAKV